MSELIFINGGFESAESVTINPSDRGFLLGDGVFDTMLAVDGTLSFAAEHAERLKRHAQVMGITLTLGVNEFTELATALLQKNGYDEGRYAVRTTLTRGPGPRGLKIPAAQTPTLMMRAAAAPQASGDATLVISGEVRRNRGSPLSRIKSLNYGDNVLAMQEAARRGAEDAVITNNRGMVCCATSSNIFAVVDGQWVTPPLSDGVLDGIMRSIVIRDKKVQETSLRVENLKRASAIYLTNSLTGLRQARLMD